MSEHTLKVAPEYWDAIVSGSKTFEVRRNDRAYQRGDTLVLYPTHDARGRQHCSPTCQHLGCIMRPPLEVRRVTFVYSGDPRFGGIEPGFVVLGMKAVQP